MKLRAYSGVSRESPDVWIYINKSIDLDQAFISIIADYLLYIGATGKWKRLRVNISPYALCDTTSRILDPIPNFIAEQYSVSVYKNLHFKNFQNPEQNTYTTEVPEVGQYLRYSADTIMKKAEEKNYIYQQDGSVTVREIPGYLLKEIGLRGVL